MKETSVSLGVRLLKDELVDPRQPELQKVDWELDFVIVDGKPVVI